MESAPGRRIGTAGRRRLPGGAGAELGGLAAGDGLLLLRHAGVAGVPVGGRALVLAKRRPESPGPARVRLGPARARDMGQHARDRACLACNHKQMYNPNCGYIVVRVLD